MTRHSLRPFIADMYKAMHLILDGINADLDACADAAADERAGSFRHSFCGRTLCARAQRCRRRGRCAAPRDAGVSRLLPGHDRASILQRN
jgi:hypothetical protein